MYNYVLIVISSYPQRQGWIYGWPHATPPMHETVSPCHTQTKGTNQFEPPPLDPALRDALK